MNIHDISYHEIISITKNKELSNVYDVQIKMDESMGVFQEVECHLTLYPYSRKLCASHVLFLPFEEYVKDISSHQRSAYSLIGDQFNNLFGVFLGIAIVFIFYFLKPDDLLSVESIVSVLGAYIIGRDIWADIEKALINISKKWRIRYTENYYLYQLEKSTTLTQYSFFAKKQRYGIHPLLPEQMDLLNRATHKPSGCSSTFVMLRKPKMDFLYSIHPY